jgi:hypothetical protein
MKSKIQFANLVFWGEVRLSGLVFTKLWDYVNGKNPLGIKASTNVTGTELQQLGLRICTYIGSFLSACVLNLDMKFSVG